MRIKTLDDIDFSASIIEIPPGIKLIVSSISFCLHSLHRKPMPRLRNSPLWCFTLGDLTLKPSDFCNIGVNLNAIH